MSRRRRLWNVSQRSGSGSQSPSTKSSTTTDPRLRVIADALAKAVEKKKRTPPSKLKEMDETIDHLLDMWNNVLRDMTKE